MLHFGFQLFPLIQLEPTLVELLYKTFPLPAHFLQRYFKVLFLSAYLLQHSLEFCCLFSDFLFLTSQNLYFLFQLVGPVLLVAQRHLVKLYFLLKFLDRLFQQHHFFIIFVAVSLKLQFQGGNGVFEFFNLLGKLFAEVFFFVEFGIKFRHEPLVVEDLVLFLVVYLVEFLLDVLDFPV